MAPVARPRAAPLRAATHLLLHKPDLLPQPAHVKRAEVDAIQHDAARLRVVKPFDEPGDGRLARPAGADERDH